MADDLYRQRLDDGLLFRTLPASALGLRCALWFVQDGPRRKQCEKELSLHRVGSIVNEAALCAHRSARYELASSLRLDHIVIRREERSLTNLNSALVSQASLLVTRGLLADAVDSATESLEPALGRWNKYDIILSYAERSWALALFGRVGAAVQDFARAKELEKNCGIGHHHRIRRTLSAELLLRTGHSSLAAERATKIIPKYKRLRWNDAVAVCHWLIAACNLAEDKLDHAEAELRQAESVFHGGQLLFDFARTQVTAGQIALARRDADTALDRATEALNLAQSRGMRLVHADALVVRGRARLLETEQQGSANGRESTLLDSLKRSVDDAEYALHIARQSSYVWAERDALLLQADSHTAMASAQHDTGNEPLAERHHHTARRTRDEAESLAFSLQLTDSDLTLADTEAARWLEQREKKYRNE